MSFGQLSVGMKEIHHQTKWIRDARYITSSCFLMVDFSFNRVWLEVGGHWSINASICLTMYEIYSQQSPSSILSAAPKKESKLKSVREHHQVGRGGSALNTENVIDWHFHSAGYEIPPRLCCSYQHGATACRKLQIPALIWVPFIKLTLFWKHLAYFRTWSGAILHDKKPVISL